MPVILPSLSTEPTADGLLDEPTIMGLRALFNESGLSDLFERGLEGYEAGCRALLAAPASREEVRQHAHAIKGSSATLGFTRISALAREIEAGSPSAPVERIEELGSQLRQALADTRAAVVARGMLAAPAKA